MICTIVVQMLPLGKLDDMHKESLLFLTTACDSTMVITFQFKKKGKQLLTLYSQGQHNSHII